MLLVAWRWCNTVIENWPQFQGNFLTFTLKTVLLHLIFMTFHETKNLCLSVNNWPCLISMLFYRMKNIKHIPTPSDFKPYYISFKGQRNIFFAIYNKCNFKVKRHRNPTIERDRLLQLRQNYLNYMCFEYFLIIYILPFFAIFVFISQK